MSVLLLALASMADPTPIGGADDPGSPVAGPTRLGPQAVVGGAPADPDRWPDAAAVFSNGFFACSGVLIGPHAVLTAGHCGWNVTEVVVGGTDHTADGERIEVIETHVYPDPFATFDVALLILARDAVTPPRAVALDCIVDDFLTDDAPVTIVGFGAIDTAASVWTTVLHEAWSTVVDHDCDRPEAGCNTAVMPGGELIAGGDGVDSCNGDSGGPLYLDTPAGAWLVGITSRAADPASAPCGDGGIYVRTDAIVDWLDANLDAPVPRPDCAGMNRAPRIEVAGLAVSPGESGVLTLRVDDPNPADRHRFAIVEGPRQGNAAIDPTGRLLYTASIDALGDDRVVVRVEDDGAPPLGAAVEVPIAIGWPAARAAGACDTTGRLSPLSLLLGFGVFAARRRATR